MTARVHRCPYCRAANPTAEALAVHIRRVHDVDDDLLAGAEVPAMRSTGADRTGRRKQNIGLARAHAATLELVATMVLLVGLVLAVVLGVGDRSQLPAATGVALASVVSWGLLRASAAQLHLAADGAESARRS